MACRFQVDWLSNPKYKDWISECDADIHRAKCIVCHSTFSLSNMGGRALNSHAKSTQHQKRLNAMHSSLSLETFASETVLTSTVSSNNAKNEQSTVEFVKQSILKENLLAIHKVNLANNENLLPVDDLDLGFATRTALKRKNKEKKIPDGDIFQFRKDCLVCLKAFVLKLIERSPLCFSLTKAVTCFDPQVATNTALATSRIKRLLSILVENGWINGSTADKAQREYKFACSQAFVLEALKKFNRTHNRVDVLWRDLFKVIEDSKNITKVMKLVMSLSHGNANVERGFSINSQCLIENLKEETLISQRMVYDTIISTAGDLHSYEIPKSLILSFRNAHSLMKESVKKREHEDSNMQALEAKRKKTAMIKKELEQKILKIKEDATKEINTVIGEIDLLSK